MATEPEADSRIDAVPMKEPLTRRASHSTLKYRREIDGLRAIAVLPVLLFHAGMEAFRGGFVGVDVFFVISGYLITGIIIGEIGSEQGFSIARFYERRARRILPALYLVLIPSTIAAWLLLVPDQLENYGQSLFATTLFSNNLLLALTAGYWDVLTELKPLVHTWTLAVEEQFYIVFPLVLLVLRRQPTKVIVGALVVALATSLALAEISARNPSDGAFYLPHLRAWELLVGALCAYRLHGVGPTRNDAAALCGLLMIFFAVLAFDETTPFPSAWGLLPVLGTALIILFTTAESRVGQFLSVRPMVLVGLISYSAYLWHQPVYAFARAYFENRPSPLALVMVTPLILLISYLSWRYIEIPFRDRRRVSLRALCCILVPLSAAFVVIGGAMHLTHGFPTRVSPDVPEGSRSSDYNPMAFRYKVDHFSTQKPVRLLVVGSSFGRDVVNMVVETFGEDSIEIVYRDDLACPAGSALADRSTVIFVSYMRSHDVECMSRTLDQAGGKPVFYFGSKSFGTNINWIMRMRDRANLRNVPDRDDVEWNRQMAEAVPPQHFVSVMDRITIDGLVAFTDERGRLLSDDTQHLTRAGAIYVGARVFEDPRLRAALVP